MESTDKKIVSAKDSVTDEMKKGWSWDIPHCLFFFGDDNSADKDVKTIFEIKD